MNFYNFDVWSKKIYNAIKHKKHKKIILLAGASCSGKSFNALRLAKQLGCWGKKVAVISSDNYYKSFARIITEKTYLHNNFNEQLNKIFPQVLKIVYENTKNVVLSEKFNAQNFEKINKQLCELLPADTAKNFMMALHKEYLSYNFDEPSALDFDRLAEDINILTTIRDKEVYYPSYQFDLCESVFSAENKIISKDYDYIIIEGLFVLRPELLQKINPKYILKTAVNCDISTMLSRLLNRNVNSKRAANTQEKIILSFVTNIIPSYIRYIQPTLQEANLVVDSTPETNEIEDVKWQRKYPVSDDIIKIIENNKLKLVSSTTQYDFLLEHYNPVTNEHIDITLRKENNTLNKLTIKSNKLKNTNSFDNLEEFNLIKILPERTKNINLLIKMFSQAKYIPTIIIKKERKIYEYNGYKFKLDYIPELGNFIELFPMPIKNLKHIIKLLNLNTTKQVTYFDIYKQVILNKEHQLKAIELKVVNPDKNQLETEFVKQNVIQYLLPFENMEVQNILKNIFKNEIDISILGTCYIEEIESNFSIVALDVEEGRIFFKQKLNIDEAKKIIEKYNKTQKHITRYNIVKSFLLTANIDEDGNNYKIRIRFDRDRYNLEKAIGFTKTFLNDKTNFTALDKIPKISKTKLEEEMPELIEKNSTKKKSTKKTKEKDNKPTKKKSKK